MMTESERELTHETVLLTEALNALDIKSGGLYIDGTFGRGGHSIGLLDRLGSAGRLIAIDKDPEAVRYGREKLADDSRFSIFHASYKEVFTLCRDMGYLGKVNGVLLDLGVSSPQIDDALRGFSFQRDGKLDMRMNTESGITASDWIASAKEQEMAAVFRDYGEERFSKRIARAIASTRKNTPITHTRQLAEIIAAANPAWEKGKDPATRCFQAIRIYLNQELDDLNAFLQNILSVLADNGRLVVISFHSLEDRIVKQFINVQSKGDDYPRDLPVTQDMLKPKIRKVGKMVRATDQEVAKNPRARSAVMRVAEKIAVV